MTKPKYRRLTYDDRRVIENMCKAKKTQSEIANAIGVSQSTISRELSRNRVEGVYTHGRAFMRTYLRLLLKPKRYLIGENEADILETFLKKKWSPETISSVCFDKKISHQTIYNYIERERQLGGTLHRYLFFKRRRRKYGIKDYRGQIRNRVSIESRPEIVAERSRFGDWEGDLIMGKNHKGAILTLVERRSKYLCATYLSGKDAKATRNGVIKLLRGMNVKTITFDNGKEFAYHEDMSKRLRSEIYFAHPYTSYERGLNEYTNRLLRQYFPKGMDLRKATERELKFALNEINSRPRKSLNWKSPSDYLHELKCAAP